MEGLRNKFLKWKEAIESKGLKVDLGKAKVMVCGIGTVKCFGRAQIRKYTSQPQCQFEDVPYSTSHKSISRKKPQQA